MLDFTYDFATALYFALKQAMCNETFAEEDCEVILIDTKIFDELDNFGFEYNVHFTNPTAKYNQNSILQNGLLMYFDEPPLNEKLLKDIKINRMDYIERLDCLIQEYISTLTEEEYAKRERPESLTEYIESFEPIIARISIKHDIHIEIFNILQKMRRSGKYLFSGTDAIKMEQDEKNYISKLKNKKYFSEVNDEKYYTEIDENGNILKFGKCE